MNIITEIKMYSQWKATKDMSIGIGSNSMNPNTTRLPIPMGTTLTWEEDSNNGNVWFHVAIDGLKHRGKIECGRITSLIKDGSIELLDNGKKNTIYKGDFLQQLLK